MSDHFKVRMTDPVANSGLGSRKEIVQDCDFMAKKHESIYKVRTNKASPASDKDALASRWWKKFYGKKPRQCCVGDGPSVRMVD